MGGSRLSNLPSEGDLDLTLLTSRLSRATHPAKFFRTTFQQIRRNRLPDDPKVDPFQSSTALGQPSAFSSRVAARHQNRVNIAFADGHVEAFAGTTIVTNGSARFPQVPVIWTPDPQINPNTGVYVPLTTR